MGTISLGLVLEVYIVFIGLYFLVSVYAYIFWLAFGQLKKQTPSQFLCTCSVKDENNLNWLEVLGILKPFSSVFLPPVFACKTAALMCC